MTVQEIQERIAANSRAWHETEDKKKRKALHQENVELHGLLDNQTGSTSSFDSGTGRWTTTAAGAGNYQGQSAPEVTDLSGQIVARQEAATAKSVAALERAREKERQKLAESQREAGQDYQAARNRAAAENEVERKNLNRQANDYGLSSGAAGQVALSQSMALQGRLGALDAQEAAEAAKLDASRSEMERDYALAIAEAQAEGDLALADALYKEAARFDEAQRERWREQEAMGQDIYELAQEGRRYATQLQLSQEQRDYDRSLDDWEHRWAEEERAYDRGQDALDRQSAAERWAYEKGQDALDRQEAAQERAYQREQDVLDRQESAERWAYEKEQDALDRQETQAAQALRARSLRDDEAQTQFENALKLARERAELGDFQGYLGLGFSQSQVDTMTELWRYWKAYK